MDVPRSSRYPNNPGVRCLDVIGAHLTAAGIPNVMVEQTGGGTATLYAGTILEQPDFGPRYTLVAGPGWFEPHWSEPNCRGFATLGDFYFGPDDDGATEPQAVPLGNEEQIAQHFLTFIHAAEADSH